MTGIYFLGPSIHERLMVETNSSILVGIKYLLFGSNHYFLRSNLTCHLHVHQGVGAMNSDEEGLSSLSFCNTMLNWLFSP